MIHATMTLLPIAEADRVSSTRAPIKKSRYCDGGDSSSSF